MENQSTDYYLKNKDQFIENASVFFQFFQQAAEERITHDTNAITGNALDRFEKLLQRMPYIGGAENFLTQNLLSGAAIFCLYQTMKSIGYPIAQIGQLVYESICLMTQAQGYKKTPDSREAARIILKREQAAEYSQNNPFPYGWLTRFVEGDGETFDWGVDYTTCGICKLFEEQNAAEFIPYVCFLDLPLYQAQGIGLNRTKTIARGDEKCDFRFNLRGEYNLEWLPDFYMTDENPPIG